MSVLISYSVYVLQNYESWLAVDKVTATVVRLTFLDVYTVHYSRNTPVFNGEYVTDAHNI